MLSGGMGSGFSLAWVAGVWVQASGCTVGALGWASRRSWVGQVGVYVASCGIELTLAS